MKHLASLVLKLRNRHFLTIDTVIFLITPTVALVLRTDSLAMISSHGASLLAVTIAFLLIKLAIFFVAGLYQQAWRYASVDELALIAISGLAALCVQALFFFAVLRPLGWVVSDFPRSLVFIEGLLAIPAMGAVRYSMRFAEQAQRRTRGRSERKRVVVVGAGEAGVMIVNEMQNNPQLGLQPVAFIDDDVQKHRSRIRGLTVLGGCDQLPRLVRDVDAHQVIIAMPRASGKVVRDIVQTCTRLNLETKTIPGIFELLGGAVSVNQLRDVKIEDLLRRAPVHIDTPAVDELIGGRRVLVTGGGGSIGSEICRQIMRHQPSEIIILGHGENSVFKIHSELLSYLASGGTHRDGRAGVQRHPKLRQVIADVRFADRIQGVFDRYRPDLVFHAAAHKHVPLMEINPSEAITNNVLGTRNLLGAAIAADVQHFVMISTDKAVNPTSVMGASKRVAELLVHQAARMSRRPYVAVRFGNVLGSRGSVVLTFRKQIAGGGPVTVTDPDMRRYFMTIPEAVQLVLQAAALGKGGEVFMLDMGEPIKIVDLARDMIRLSGLDEERDIDIVFTGLRPGEKLYEELFVPGEKYQPTLHEKVFIASTAARAASGLQAAVDDLADAAHRDDHALMLDLLSALVPESQLQRAEPVAADEAAPEKLLARAVGGLEGRPAGA